MQYKNLLIIGTSHISRDSINNVEKAFSSFDPEIVALELDKRRLYSIMNNIKGRAGLSEIKKVGVKGFLFLLIGGWLQSQLGKYTGVTPGSEMKTAIELARKKGIKIALIDQDIEITLKRFSQEFTWKEKLSLAKDILSSPFAKQISIDLTKVPEKTLIRKLMKETRKKYPGIYKALVDERNQVMASNLCHIMKEKPDSRVLAVMGAGHEEEVIRIIDAKFKKHTLQTHNL
ncbi:TraB family protein [Candidatus Woesearchaeota archaeon]|nr:TraB family protein [Candidatus Woesearchaeota archaeon]